MLRRTAAFLAGALVAASLGVPLASAAPPEEEVGPQLLLEGLQRFQRNVEPQRSLSVAPQVGWNAGLEDLKPPPAPWYRLWDKNVAWRDVNPAPGVFDWSELDRRIELVESWGGRPLLVLGLTPQWAALDPEAGDPRWGAGSASVPGDIRAWSVYVRAVANRYGDRIGAYEIWNEANLKTFWNASAIELAEMTGVAYEIIKTHSPNAVVLAPSVTTRLSSGARFTTDFITGLSFLEDRQAAIPFDAWTIHSYPAGNAGVSFDGTCKADPVAGEEPDDCIDGVSPKLAAQQRTKDIRLWQQAVVEAGGAQSPLLDLPIWDTEVNYGLPGPGIIPGVSWRQGWDELLMSYTLGDSISLGIANVFWYQFTAEPYDLLGVQMTPGSRTAATYSSLTPLRSGALFELPILTDDCVYILGLNCPGVDLKNRNLNGSNLRSSNLTGADLYRANFFGSNLGRADLKGARLFEANLTKTDALQANFSGSNMRRIKARNADWRGANFRRVDFRGADLRGVNFQGANLNDANFRGADLTGANICNTDIRGTNLQGAKTTNLRCG